MTDENQDQPSTSEPNFPEPQDLPTPMDNHEAQSELPLQPTSSLPIQPAPPSMPTGPIVDGQQVAAASPQPVAPAEPSPQVVVSGGARGPKSKRTKTVKISRKKMFIGIIILVVLILGGGAYAYFGYYMSSSTVWNDSLGNASTGYDSLVGYLNKQSGVHYQGTKANGSFSSTAGSTHTSGNLSFQSYSKASTSSFDIDLGTGNLGLQEIGVPVSGASEPDIYIKATGLSQLVSYLGSYGPALNQYNNQWILIDHNLLEDIASEARQSQVNSPKAQLTWSEINSYLQTTEQINKKYVFTSNKTDAVLVIDKSYGKATVDNHSTYEYLVGFNKSNVKAYVSALCNALNQSSFGSYLKQETNNDFPSNSSCQSAANSANNIKSSDTFTLWDNISTRLPYKVRINENSQNPAESYVEIGLNYNGGSSYPFFFDGKDGNTTFTVNMTLNTSSNSLTTDINAGSGKGGNQFNGSFNFQPSNANLKVTAPTSSVPITTVLNSLGLSSFVNDLSSIVPDTQRVIPL